MYSLRKSSALTATLSENEKNTQLERIVVNNKSEMSGALKRANYSINSNLLAM